MKEYNDFGFSIVDETELDASATMTAKVENAEKLVDEYWNRLDKMHRTVLPLLFNLKSNPEKDMIHWPNRVEKIDAFIAKLDDIKNGKA